MSQADPAVKVIVLYGAGGSFCAGADLKALSGAAAEAAGAAAAGGSTSSSASGADGAFSPSSGASNPMSPVQPCDEAAGASTMQAHTSDIGPMGLSRLVLTKPVIAAVAGACVAGGLELACWCDLRVAERSATFGVFCRRWGVPLIDGGTVRLPRLIGQSRAMDMILTGRAVGAEEALQFGLVNRICEEGQARQAAEELALSLCRFPQHCMRQDRWSALHQHSKLLQRALADEFEPGMDIVRREGVAGATRFAKGAGRGGNFGDIGGEAAAASVSAIAPSTSAAVRPVPSSASTSGLGGSSTPLHAPAPTLPIQVVMFDLGGVVVDSPVAAILQFEREHGMPRHSVNMLLGRSAHFHALERGDVDLESAIPLLQREAAERGGLPALDVRALFERMAAVRVRPAMARSITALRRAGLIVGAVTNNWKDRAADARGALIDQSGVDALFDFVVESCIVRARKPDAAIFTHALQQAEQARNAKCARLCGDGGGGGVAACSPSSSSSSSSSSSPSAPAPFPRLLPGRVVFLDDLGANLKGARTAGLHTIKVETDYARALRQLQQMTGVQLECNEAGAEPSASATPLQPLQLQAKL